MALHERIKLLRNSKKIPQSVVAKELGITVQGYSMKENGLRSINTDELEIISKVLGESVSIFFGEEFNIKFNKNKSTA